MLNQEKSNTEQNSEISSVSESNLEVDDKEKIGYTYTQVVI